MIETLLETHHAIVGILRDRLTIFTDETGYSTLEGEDDAAESIINYLLDVKSCGQSEGAS